MQRWPTRRTAILFFHWQRAQRRQFQKPTEMLVAERFQKPADFTKRPVIRNRSENGGAAENF